MGGGGGGGGGGPEPRLIIKDTVQGQLSEFAIV